MTLTICVSDFWHKCYYYELNASNSSVMPLQPYAKLCAVPAIKKRLPAASAIRHTGGMETLRYPYEKEIHVTQDQNRNYITAATLADAYISKTKTACRRRMTLKRLYLSIDAISAFYLLRELDNSIKYRQLLNASLCNRQLKNASHPHSCQTQSPPAVELLWLQLIPPKKQIIDYKWNHMLSYSLWEHIEVEYLMSWLSTLGGGYSALGEQFERCAETAGKISLKQLLIGIRLGDPFLQARCKLYYSISLIQRGHLRAAKYIIRAQYAFARPYKALDPRLINMCHGIWMRLQYEYKQRKALHGAGGDASIK